MSRDVIDMPTGTRLNRAWCTKCEEETIHGGGLCASCGEPQRPSPVVKLDPSKFEPRATLKRPRAVIIPPVGEPRPSPEPEEVDDRPVVYATALHVEREPAPPAGDPAMTEIRTKKCETCSDEKSLSEFDHAPRSADGRTKACTACRAGGKKGNGAVQTSAPPPPAGEARAREAEAEGSQARSHAAAEAGTPPCSCQSERACEWRAEDRSERGPSREGQRLGHRAHDRRARAGSDLAGGSRSAHRVVEDPPRGGLSG